jgi:P pilus assembly chaperone PapD
MKFLYKSFSFFCFTFLALFSLQLNASVIMTGTRIIYNEGVVQLMLILKIRAISLCCTDVV